MKARYVVLGPPRDVIIRCFLSVKYFIKSEISYFVSIGSHEIFQGPALDIVFLCFSLSIDLNTSILDLLWMRTYI